VVSKEESPPCESRAITLGVPDAQNDSCNKATVPKTYQSKVLFNAVQSKRAILAGTSGPFLKKVGFHSETPSVITQSAGRVKAERKPFSST